MTLSRAFVAVAGCVVVCTAGGIGLGVALGFFAPDFYRATLPRNPSANFNPIQIGLGFGLNAGVFSGIVIGLLIVAIVAYFEMRTAEANRPRQPDTPQELETTSSSSFRGK